MEKSSLLPISINNPKENDSICNSSCSCIGGGITRRNFVSKMSLVAGGSLFLPRVIMAGPFEPDDFQNLVPADKKLDPAWLKSLFARGEKTIYHGAELEKIGLPIGGICAGQVYLGGDGKLWHWDIFNQYAHTGGENYAQPPKPNFPMEQGFGVRMSVSGKTEFRTLDHIGFSDISFRGEYPIGLVEYRDAGTPLAVSLEAYSPFVPLQAEASGLPATILRFTVTNYGLEPVTAEFVGWLQNAVCLQSGNVLKGRRRNRTLRSSGLLLIECCAVEAPHKEGDPRQEIIFEDFQKETYEYWEVTGTAFGSGPISKTEMGTSLGHVGSDRYRVVNSHASAPGESNEARDAQTGTLMSRSFVIDRNFLHFWIGGGKNPGKTCLDLLVDDKVVCTATGHNSHAMRRDSFDLRPFQGKSARLQIVDHETGPWGNIGIGEIIFSDQETPPTGELEDQLDFGTMALALLDPQAGDVAASAISEGTIAEAVLADLSEVTAPMDKKLIGALVRKLSLGAGQSVTLAFVVTWHFPNLLLPMDTSFNRWMKQVGRFYTGRFASAKEVAQYVAKEYEALTRQTHLWRDTWYDSTLPYWFLDRIMANTSILATSTAHWFRNGRFYGWEGVGCCEGTCTHVWHYAQTVGRLFPELERDLRQRTDFGTALDPKTGVIRFRDECLNLTVDGFAVDGQAGCILRVYRENQMTADNIFLKSLWPKIKLAMECLVRMDNGEGILQGAQHNTLDGDWWGKISWLSGLYVAAARACEEMATEVGDYPFAARMRRIAETGGKNIDRELFNGEYYIQLPDKDHPLVVGSFDGCHIDQVLGQSWAWQVGLGRILNEGNVRKSLASLWKYNFTPDVGPFREKNTRGRWFAMSGEGGLLTCSWPRGDTTRVQDGYDVYFNECMTGFEYQVAGHMIWEGMVQEGLAITRAVHDRYHALHRNPWNEVECGDHYARSMASYGVLLAACGFEYHGPKAHIGFAPRLTPENFKCPFTTAEGWGSFSQQRKGAMQYEMIELKWGRLRLRSLAFELSEKNAQRKVRVVVKGANVANTHQVDNGRIEVLLAAERIIQVGEKIEIHIS